MAVCVVKHARVSSIWAFQRYGAFASRSLHQHSHLEWACGVEFGRNLLDHVFCRNCRAHARLSCLEMFHHSCPGVGRFLYTFDVYWVILSTEGTRCRGFPRHRANPRKPRNRVQNPAIPACGVVRKYTCVPVSSARMPACTPNKTQQGTGQPYLMISIYTTNGIVSLACH